MSSRIKVHPRKGRMIRGRWGWQVLKGSVRELVEAFRARKRARRRKDRRRMRPNPWQHTKTTGATP